MVNIAVLGVGRMGMIHARNIANSKTSVLRAISDPDDATAKVISDETGAPIVSIDQVFADPDIEAVLIATPTDTHADLIERAANCGKAIFCEKPIDLSIDRVRKCLKVVEETNTELFVGFNRRFHNTIAKMRKRLKSGEIGKLEILSIVSYDPLPPPAGYTARSGGIFRDMMIHDIDLARWFLDEPIVAVRATGSAIINPEIGIAGDWDSAIAILKTKSGALCHIANSRRCIYGHGPRLAIHGSEGALEADNWTRTAEPVLDTKFQARFASAYQAELEYFALSLKGGKSLEPSGKDGLAALKVAEAATRAATSGKTIDPGEI